MCRICLPIFFAAVCACATSNRESNCPATLLYLVFINAVRVGATVERSAELSADEFVFGFLMLSANCDAVHERLSWLFA